MNTDRYRTKKWGIIKTIVMLPILGSVMWLIEWVR
mgnify:CR=1 FL=1|jgi:hypothetical protein|tara:strand:- start:343 stop:447 length:105 start_codon:yes stop_codon:yes gene_type:complete